MMMMWIWAQVSPNQKTWITQPETRACDQKDETRVSVLEIDQLVHVRLRDSHTFSRHL